MSSNKKGRGRALDRERLRRHRQRTPVQPEPPVFVTRRQAATRCAWCGGEIGLKSTGRLPKWCSASCRQRAWEQRRAAASGRSAIEVVERVVHVAVERDRKPRRGDWPALLRDLAAQLDAGTIYARDLPDIGDALAAVLTAYRGRR